MPDDPRREDESADEREDDPPVESGVQATAIGGRGPDRHETPSDEA